MPYTFIYIRMCACIYDTVCTIAGIKSKRETRLTVLNLSKTKWARQVNFGNSFVQLNTVWNRQHFQFAGTKSMGCCVLGFDFLQLSLYPHSIQQMF